ncbi:MAG TPA: hypothetical protein P5048_04190 [Chlamydiales bacterium]|nr:hypothetical protein [Chlamydiales bacterium]
MFKISSQIPLHSSYAIYVISSIVSTFVVLFFIPIFQGELHKDYACRINEIIFASPIGRLRFWSIRFFSALIKTYVLNALVILSVIISMRFFCPDIQGSLLTITLNSLPSLVLFLCLNSFIAGSFAFFFYGVFKHRHTAYLLIVSLFGFFSVTAHLESQKLLSSLLDPFASRAFQHGTEALTVAEKINGYSFFQGYFLYNRLLWLGIGISLFFIGYKMFFSSRTFFRRKKAVKSFNEKQACKPQALYSKKLCKKSLLHFAFFEFKTIFESKIIRIMLFALSGAILYNKYIYRYSFYPATYITIGGFIQFTSFVCMLNIMVASHLIWKERSYNIKELTHTSILSNRQQFIVKLGAAFLFNLLISTLFLVLGLIIQIFQGYYIFEWSYYFQYLFGYFLIPNLFFVFFAMAFQSLAPNSRIGYVLSIGFFIALVALRNFGYDHTLYQITMFPQMVQSSMNSFQHIWMAFFSKAFYALSLSLLLSLVILAFWKREELFSWKERWENGLRNLKMFSKKTRFIFTSLLIISASWIIYNVHFVNRRMDTIPYLAQYEREFKAFESYPIPSMVDAKLDIHLSPSKQSFKSIGVFTYENKTDKPIDKMLIATRFSADIVFDRKVEKIKQIPELGIVLYEFETPMQTGDSLQITCNAFKKEPKGFKNNECPCACKFLTNGTVYPLEYFAPLIGYDPSVEISYKQMRVKHHLPEERILTHNFKPSERITFDIKLDTEKGQQAFVCGDLVNHFDTDNSSVFRYRSTKPYSNDFAIVSGNYKSYETIVDDIPVSIYTHHLHDLIHANIINTVQSTLQYCKEHFGKYPYEKLMIIEGHCKDYCHAFPSLVVASEGFFLNKSNPNSIYKHEKSLMESIAQQYLLFPKDYLPSSKNLAVMLSKYVPYLLTERKNKKKLYESDLPLTQSIYLSNLGSSNSSEKSLIDPFLNDFAMDRKVPQVLLSMKNLVKEEVFDSILQEIYNEELIDFSSFISKLKQKTPSNMHYLIEDSFEKVVFYEHEITHAKVSQKEDLFEVNLDTIHKKFECIDFSTFEKSIENEFIDICILDKAGQVLYLEAHPIESLNNHFKVTLSEKPSKIVIDPYKKMLNRTGERTSFKF